MNHRQDGISMILTGKKKSLETLWEQYEINKEHLSLANINTDIIIFDIIWKEFRYKEFWSLKTYEYETGLIFFTGGEVLFWFDFFFFTLFLKYVRKKIRFTIGSTLHSSCHPLCALKRGNYQADCSQLEMLVLPKLHWAIYTPQDWANNIQLITLASSGKKSIL